MLDELKEYLHPRVDEPVLLVRHLHSLVPSAGDVQKEGQMFTTIEEIRR
jgi:hypothetical protein